MSFETILGIICLILAAVCGIVRRYFSKNVYLTYKEQKVGGKRRDH